jgi:hypothetical protein
LEGDGDVNIAAYVDRAVFARLPLLQSAALKKADNFLTAKVKADYLNALANASPRAFIPLESDRRSEKLAA